MSRSAPLLLSALLPAALIAQGVPMPGQSAPPPVHRAPAAVHATPAVMRAAPPAVTLTLTEYHIAGPASIPSGVTAFHAIDAGKELHHAMLVKLAPGKTVADFAAALKVPGPPPAWATFMGGPQSGATTLIDVTPGTYVWLCVIPSGDGVPHFAKGMVAPMTVTTVRNGAAVPQADVVVTMQDYGWTFSRPVTAGHHILKLVTAPGQPHEFVLVRLKPGKSPAEVGAWVHGGFAGTTPIESIDGIAALQTGQTNYADVTFRPGHYAVFCFAPDAKDGKEHYEHGMVTDFTVR